METIIPEQEKKDKIKISLRNISKSFGKKTVLDSITLDIYEGEIFCIIGKSGTGKSVILKNMIGLMLPDSGEIFVDGAPFNTAPVSERDSIREKFGVLFQMAALFDSMNIYDNVAFGMRRQGVPEDTIKNRVTELLGQVGLRDIESRMPSELSGGMQKRVGLARSIAMKPEIMLYDEPTTAVDPITGGAVDRLIMSMNDLYKITSVVITHDMNSAFHIADRIAMLHRGKIIFLGTPDELKSSGDPIVIQFLEGRADGPA